MTDSELAKSSQKDYFRFFVVHSSVQLDYVHLGSVAVRTAVWIVVDVLYGLLYGGGGSKRKEAVVADLKLCQFASKAQF